MRDANPKQGKGECRDVIWSPLALVLLQSGDNAPSATQAQGNFDVDGCLDAPRSRRNARAAFNQAGFPGLLPRLKTL